MEDNLKSLHNHIKYLEYQADLLSDELDYLLRKAGMLPLIDMALSKMALPAVKEDVLNEIMDEMVNTLKKPGQLPNIKKLWFIANKNQVNSNNHKIIH